MIFKYIPVILLYKMGLLALQDLATSRFQILCVTQMCAGSPIHEANVHVLTWLTYSERLCMRHANFRVLSHPWLSCRLTELCDILILGQRMVKICLRVPVTAIKLK
jgi:hypothetical protein